MTRFNLSEWAEQLRHRRLHAGLPDGRLIAYERLGREEDPDFSIQTMVVQASWPGASVTDTLTQLTDRSRRSSKRPQPRLPQELHQAARRPSSSTSRRSTPSEEIEDIWYQVRKKIDDIRMTLPKGVVGPFFNDEFGDVFGIVYGITYDGFTPREARDFAETARAEFLRSPDVGKVEIFGDQDRRRT